MQAQFWVTTPPSFISAQGTGQFNVAQLIDAQNIIETSVGSITESTLDYELDSPYPMYNSPWTDAGPQGSYQLKSTADTPNHSISEFGVVTNKLSMNEKFELFVVYAPPPNGVGCDVVCPNSMDWWWVSTASRPLNNAIWAPPDGNPEFFLELVWDTSLFQWTTTF